MELVRINMQPQTEAEFYKHMFAVHYVSRHVGIPDFLLAPKEILQIEDGDEHLGSVLLNNYLPLKPGKSKIEATFAADSSKAWTRKIIRELFDFVFNFMQCVRVEANCAEDNLKVSDYLDRAGFILEGRLQKGWDGKKDRLVYGMTKDNCNWLEAK